MCKSNNQIGIAALSVILGIIVGAIFYLGRIPNIVTTIWILFGIAALNYVLYFIYFVFNQETDRESCRCRYGNSIIVGILGTIVSAAVALGVNLMAGSTLMALLIGIGGFFASLMIISLLMFLLCQNEDCNCSCNYECR